MPITVKHYKSGRPNTEEQKERAQLEQELAEVENVSELRRVIQAGKKALLPEQPDPTMSEDEAKKGWDQEMAIAMAQTMAQTMAQAMAETMAPVLKKLEALDIGRKKPPDRQDDSREEDEEDLVTFCKHFWSKELQHQYILIG